MHLSRDTMRHVHGWLLLMPAAILLIAFTYYPTVATLIDSFFSRGTAVRPSKFIGLANYQTMIEDPIFWKVLSNNAWFAIGTIPTSIALAIAMAMFVNRNLPGQSFVRMAYFTPTVLPMIAVANIWLFSYSPDIGLIDQIAKGMGFSGHNWLGDPATALPAAPSLAEVGDLGKIVDSQGIVSMRPKMASRWSAASKNLTLKPGDWLRTDVRGANALAFRLRGGGQVILGPGTLVEVIDAKTIAFTRGEIEIAAVGVRSTVRTSESCCEPGVDWI